MRLTRRGGGAGRRGPRPRPGVTGRPCPVSPSPGLGPQSPGAAARPPEARRDRRPPCLFAAHCPPPGCARSPSSERGAGHQGYRRTPPTFLPPRERPSDQARFAAGTAGLGRLPRTRIASPRPEPPDPSVAPSGGAETRGQAPRRREEAAPAGRGEAGRGRLPGPARRDLGAIISKNKGSWGRPGAPPPPAPGPGPELELVLDTLSGRWRGNPSEPGRGSCAHLPCRGAGEHAPLGSRREPGVPRCPRMQGFWGPRPLLGGSGCERGLGSPAGGVGRGPAPPAPQPYPGQARSRRGAGPVGFSARRVGRRYSAAN